MKTARRTGALLLAFAVVAAAACGNGKKTEAEASLKAAQDAFASVSADAQKYAPDQARAIQTALSSAQSSMASKDYAAVLTQTQGLPARISDLGGAISSKKAEYASSWNDLSGSVPKMLAALQSRVDILAQSKHPPTGLTAATIANAKTGASAATQAWSDASAAAQSGDVAAAVSRGTAVKTQVLDLMRSLNMQVAPGGGD